MTSTSIASPATQIVTPGPDGWASVRAWSPLAPNTWRTLGVLEVPPGGVIEHVAIGVIGQGAKLEDVDVWCPAIFAGWLSIPAFTEACRDVRLVDRVPFYARNRAEVAVDVDARFRVGKSAPPALPDLSSPYYASRAWRETYYRGVPVLKCPLDLWVMQEILYEVKPTLLIETGTFMGGSALYFLDVLDTIMKHLEADVFSIDVETRPDLPEPGEINYLVGSSTSEEILTKVREMAEHEAKIRGRTLVVLDSDHSYDHVLAELRAYAPLVSIGSYLVVEDTNNPGPHHAVQDFLASPEGKDFSPDYSREKHGLTLNPGGWLRKRGGL